MADGDVAEVGKGAGWVRTKNLKRRDICIIISHLDFVKLKCILVLRSGMKLMAATVHVLRPQSPPLAGFLRLGHTGHRKLADLHAAGRFPYRRIVVDAAHLVEQRDLLRTLKQAGCEIVLDPNAAEMATVGRFNSSSLQKLAWSNPDRPWEAGDFGSHRNHDAAQAIAQFAVEADIAAILAPTHLVDAATTGWRAVDLRLCEALRHELDRAGGREIAIDYQLITTSSVLKDALLRDKIAAEIASLPIENVWLRVSGFGATATGAGTRTFVESVRSLHAIGRPLIVDMAGGFAGLATMAMGAVAGISHGVGQKESFKASDWNKPPSGGGGAGARTYIPDLDRYFKEDQLQAIYAARGGRSRFSCNDGSCCPGGAEDMFESAHAHFLTQRHRQIEDLSNTPELRRTEHFLLRQLDPAIRSARFAAKLKIEDEKVVEVVGKAKTRMIRLRDALADLDSTGQPDTRSPAPLFRGGSKGMSAVLGQ